MIEATHVGYARATATAMPPGYQALTSPTGAKEPTRIEWPVDTVEVTSTRGTEAADPLSDPRVREIRDQVLAGTYLTEDKIDAVTGRLHAMLRNESSGAHETIALP